VLVEEEQGGQGLRLGSRRHVLFVREVREEGRDVAGAELGGVPLPAVNDVAADPVDIRLLGAEAVVPNADRLANAGQKGGAGGVGHGAANGSQCPNNGM
jgi:hypothetical protein